MNPVRIDHRAPPFSYQEPPLSQCMQARRPVPVLGPVCLSHDPLLGSEGPVFGCHVAGLPRVIPTPVLGALAKLTDLG